MKRDLMLLCGIIFLTLLIAGCPQVPEDSYNITYVLNEGAFSGSYPRDYTESAGTALTAPKRFCRAFGGWYESEDFAGDAVTEIPSGSTGDKTFYAKWTWETYALGDRGPSNGWIFEIRDDETAGDPMDSANWKYREACSADKEVPTYYPACASYCADLSLAYEGFTFDDWTVPTIEELRLMYTNLAQAGLGGFKTDNPYYYWSSSGSTTVHNCKNFITVSGGTTPGNELNYTITDYECRMRAVRTF